MSIVYYPGSWNPLHAGHLAIAHYLESLGYNVVFELSSKRFQKDDLLNAEIDSIVSQFKQLDRNIIVTKAKSFLEKMRYIQELRISKSIGSLSSSNDKGRIKFAIGADTANRLCDVNLSYFSSYEEMTKCHTIFGNNCEFLIFPRYGVNYTWDKCKTFTDIPYKYFSDFTPVNISSTELRQK